MGSSLLGSSRWFNWKGVEKSRALQGGALIFGNPVIDGDTVPDRYAARGPWRHFLSVAPTRSGKGVSLIIPNLLLYWGSAIVIDPKGENAWITAKHRRSMGQKVIILDPWGEVNRRYGDKAGLLETVARFNPLSILDPKSLHYADDLAYLADALIINQGKDPHWDDSARELVSGLIAYAVEVYPELATLSFVRVMLTKPAEEISGIAKEAQKLGPESVAARKLGRFVTDSKEIASIVSTALTQTAFLDSATLEESLAVSDFAFEDLVTRAATIYLVLPVDKLQTYGRWLRLMVSIGIRTVARNVAPLNNPVLFILDEFGTIGRLSAVAQAFGLMSGLQMCMWAFVQDLVQLKRDYPDDWETFIGNSEAVTFFNVMDQFSCEHFSKMLGTTTVERISQATANEREGGIFKSANPNYMKMTDQEFSRDLLQPAEIRTFREDAGILLWRHPPMMFQKIIYYEDDFFLVRARHDPNFPEMLEKQRALLAELAKKDAAARIPNLKAAQEAAEKAGYKVEKSGLLVKKITITSPDGESQTFSGEAQFIEWARSFV